VTQVDNIAVSLVAGYRLGDQIGEATQFLLPVGGFQCMITCGCAFEAESVRHLSPPESVR